jgi:hypothetical protein
MRFAGNRVKMARVRAMGCFDGARVCDPQQRAKNLPVTVYSRALA